MDLPPATTSAAEVPLPLAARRLFVALWPSPTTRRGLGAWMARWTWPRHAAVIAPERLHLTLHFLGQVPEERLAELRTALAAPALELKPFDLCFDQVAFWPHGLVVLGATELPDALRQLHARLADTLRSLGLPVEARAFRPHLTLARKAPHAVPPAEQPAFRWPVRSYALVQSEHGYHTLQTYRRRPAA